MKKKLKRSFAMIFVAFHMLAVTWWVISPQPWMPFENGALWPSVLITVENAVAGLKANTTGSAWSACVTAYLRMTDNTQSWRMFAPNPAHIARLVTVYGVRDWDAQHHPIYDPEPLYKSYPGAPQDYQPGNLSGYSHDTKVMDRITRDPRSFYLQEFSRYWARRYRRSHSDGTKGVQVVLNTVPIFNLFEGPIYPSQAASFSSSSPDFAGRVIWHIEY